MNPLDLLETPLRELLRFLHTEANLTYGWAIVTLTVIVRLVLLPLAIQQIKGMKKMQVHNPAIQEIRRKYANDKPKQRVFVEARHAANGANRHPFAQHADGFGGNVQVSPHRT